MNRWLQAFRLRTLPVALAPALTGIALATPAVSPGYRCAYDIDNRLVAGLINLANDWGLFSGVDDETRVGPARHAAGLITAKEMIWIFSSFF